MSLYLLIFLLLKVDTVGASLTQNSYPDVIKCDNHFYYIGFSSPTVSRYYAVTGQFSKIQSYQIVNGVLTNKEGYQAGNCENETVEQLWNSNKAFRVSNQGLTTSLSIYNAQNYPDAIKCQNKIVKISIFLKSTTMFFYYNAQGQRYASLAANSPPNLEIDIDCQNKAASDLKTNGQAYNFVTQVLSSQSGSIYSMTGKYPDSFICGGGAILFIYSISDDQSRVVYRSENSSQLNQVIFTNNGSVQQSKQGSHTIDCGSKSIPDLIGQNRAFNINYPVLICPDDITTVNPVVNFIVSATPILTVVSTPTSGSQFPLGETTITVRGTHSSGLNLQCTFGVTLQPDKLAPTVTCPNNIEQLEPKVDYEATATDNSILPIKIIYDKDPGSIFKTGNTTVKVTAIDGAGNEAFCTFGVNILPDIIAPTVSCPNNIEQLEPIVDFEATATDNQSKTVNISYDIDPGSTFKTGKTTVSVTAQDAAGNQAFCTFEIIIISDQQSSSDSMIGIIIGSVIAIVAVVVAVIIVVVLKKKKKGCFKVKEPRSQRYQFTKRKSSQPTDPESASSKRIQW